MLTKSRVVGGLTAAVLAVSVISALPAAAASDPRGWAPDANVVGGLYFYDSTGHQITTGSINDAPMATYYVASGGQIAGSTGKDYMATSTPVQGQDSAAWAGTQIVTSSQSQPLAGLPGALAGNTTNAIVKSVAADLSLNAYQIANFPNASAVAGYQHLYEVRVYTGNSTTWYSAVVSVSGTTWTQVWPQQTATALTDSTSNSSVVTSGTIGSGTSLTLYAAVAPTVTGKVTWYEGATVVAGPTAVDGSGKASATFSPADGAHLYTAKFDPTPGSVNLPSTAADVSIQVGAVADTTSTALTVTPGAAVAGVSQQLQAVVTDVTTPASTPVGSVAFYDNGSVTAVAGSVTESPAGTFTLNTTALAVGGHSIVAKFTPTNSALFAASMSTSQVFTLTSPVTVPGAPRAVTGIPGVGLVVVRWAAPLSNGGSAITGYKVYTVPSGKTCVTAALTCTITGLVNGAAYRFYVFATNAPAAGGYGVSGYSALVIPRTKPTAPRLLKATFPAHLKTLVTWYAPLSTGGSAITSYYVRWSINGRTWTTWARTGVLKYAYKLGLPAGRRAYVEVMAYNVAGFSPIAILGFIPTR